MAGDNGPMPPKLVLSAARCLAAVGDRVVTSGFGGMFPPGLPVGTVAQRQRQRDPGPAVRGPGTGSSICGWSICGRPGWPASSGDRGRRLGDDRAVLASAGQVRGRQLFPLALTLALMLAAWCRCRCRPILRHAILHGDGALFLGDPPARPAAASALLLPRPRSGPAERRVLGISSIVLLALSFATGSQRRFLGGVLFVTLWAGFVGEFVRRRLL